MIQLKPINRFVKNVKRSYKLILVCIAKGEAKTKEGASNGLGKAKAIYVRLSFDIRATDRVCLPFLDLGERSDRYFCLFFP